ncbi:MAG TPA: glycosyltransferase family 2 protein, partial [Blastocatellia bacterium]|nr:glycosyltransferase family 2 protein [Blastocatellia bacterium]
MRDVSIVVPSWNARALLAEYLPSVIAATEQYRGISGRPAEIVVVDDGSTDDTLSLINERFGNNSLIRTTRLDSNSGFVAAANAGFEAARFDIIVLLNNDVRVEPDALAPLIAHFEDDSLFAVCSKAIRLGTNHLDGGGKLGLFERGFWRVYLNYDVLAVNEGNARWQSFFGSGGYTAYSAAKLKTLGGFNELLAPAYWEDVEICYRAWKRGWTVEYEPNSVVYHVSSATMGAPALQRKMKIVSERNRLLTTWMNLHDRGWFCSHLVWLALKLIAATISLDLIFWRGFVQAVRVLPETRSIRRREREAARRSDREIDSIFRRLARSEHVRVLRNVRDSVNSSSSATLKPEPSGSAPGTTPPR